MIPARDIVCPASPPTMVPVARVAAIPGVLDVTLGEAMDDRAMHPASSGMRRKRCTYVFTQERGPDMSRRETLAKAIILSALVLATDSALPGVPLKTAAAESETHAALAARYFRVEADSKDDGKGHARIRGYVYNDYGQAANQVQLRITELDGSGSPVASYVAPIPGTVPGLNRAYFDVKVPSRAVSYRVAVDSFNWAGRN